MIAILLLALEFISIAEKQFFSERVFVLTTGWLAYDESLRKLLDKVANKHKVKLFGFASGLNFHSSKIKELRDYEKGYVKEGVGAGGLSILAYLKGFKYEEIVSECESTIKRMKEVVWHGATVHADDSGAQARIDAWDRTSNAANVKYSGISKKIGGDAWDYPFDPKGKD